MLGNSSRIFYHILPGSRDWIWPVGAYSFHTFPLEAKQLFNQEHFSKRHVVFLWCLLRAQHRLHIVTVAVACGEKVWKARGWASAEEGRKRKGSIWGPCYRLQSMTSLFLPWPCPYKKRGWSFSQDYGTAAEWSGLRSVNKNPQRQFVRHDFGSDHTAHICTIGTSD